MKNSRCRYLLSLIAKTALSGNWSLARDFVAMYAPSLRRYFRFHRFVYHRRYFFNWCDFVSWLVDLAFISPCRPSNARQYCEAMSDFC